MNEHPDIRFLRKRLNYLVELEEYELAAIIKKWIEHLTDYYNSKILLKNERIL